MQYRSCINRIDNVGLPKSSVRLSTMAPWLWLRRFLRLFAWYGEMSLYITCSFPRIVAWMGRNSNLNRGVTGHERWGVPYQTGWKVRIVSFRIVLALRLGVLGLCGLVAVERNEFGFTLSVRAIHLNGSFTHHLHSLYTLYFAGTAVEYDDTASKSHTVNDDSEGGGGCFSSKMVTSLNGLISTSQRSPTTVTHESSRWWHTTGFYVIDRRLPRTTGWFFLISIRSYSRWTPQQRGRKLEISC